MPKALAGLGNLFDLGVKERKEQLNLRVWGLVIKRHGRYEGKEG